MSSGKRLTIPPSKDVFFADDDMGAVVGEMSDDGDEAAAVGGNVFNRADVDDNDDNTRNLTQMTPRVVKKTPIAYQTSVKTGQFRTPNLNKDALHESIRLLISAIRQRRDIEENMCFSCPAGEKIFVPGNKYTIGRFHMQANCGPFGTRVTIISPYRQTQSLKPDKDQPAAAPVQTRHALNFDELRQFLMVLIETIGETDLMRVCAYIRCRADDDDDDDVEVDLVQAKYLEKLDALKKAHSDNN